MTMESKKNQTDGGGLLRKAESVRENERGAVRRGARKRTPLFARIILRVISIILIFVLGGAAVWLATRKMTTFFEVEQESKRALVDRQLSYCQELVTEKYRYSDIITLKKTAGFAKSYSIIKYTGIIRAGIADFTDVWYSLSEDENTVTITLPPAEILGNDIVRQEVFDEKRSIFVPISTQEVFDEIEAARKVAQEDMIAEGILKDSAEYAKKIIRQFMLSCGFDDVVFR